MSADEDTELRELIVQTLESNGVLGRIKAELRASVFLALDEGSFSFREKIPIFNKKLAEFSVTTDGKKLLSLVREFLEFFGMHSTLAVFDPELSASSPLLSRNELCEMLQLPEVNKDSPVLAEFVKLDKLTTMPSSFSHLIVGQGDSHWSNCDIFSSNRNPATKKVSLDIHNKEVLNDSSMSEKDSVHSEFFDEPISYPQKSIFAISEDLHLNEKNTKEDGLLTHSSNRDDDNFFSVLKNNENREDSAFTEHSALNDKSDFPVYASDVKNRMHNGKDASSFSSESDFNAERGLSSLRDLPVLSSKAMNSYDWPYTNSHKNKLPSVSSGKVLSENCDTSSDFDHSIKSIHFSPQNSLNKTDHSDSQDNTEQSIEEEIDDDLSTGVDDLLSSLSAGEDTTTDATVSHMSKVGGYDHIEPCIISK